MKRIVKLDSIPEVGKARDSFALYDMPGFADAAMTLREVNASGRNGWFGKGTLRDAARMIREGDLSAVPAADAIMRELDGKIFLSRAFRTVDDVVGAVPNVPAYIAGIPTNMRRRTRVATASAPLSVFIDLTTSGGISASDVRKRGVAILALVRLLSNFRAVEVWAFTGLGSAGFGDFCCVRLDTAPLDLARAAHVLTSTMVARGIGYNLCHEVGGASRGAWPYGYDESKIRKHGAAILQRVTYPGSEVLLIPAMHLTDATVTAPVRWINEMLAKYGGLQEAA